MSIQVCTFVHANSKIKQCLFWEAGNQTFTFQSSGFGHTYHSMQSREEGFKTLGVWRRLAEEQMGKFTYGDAITLKSLGCADLITFIK